VIDSSIIKPRPPPVFLASVSVDLHEADAGSLIMLLLLLLQFDSLLAHAQKLRHSRSEGRTTGSSLQHPSFQFPIAIYTPVAQRFKLSSASWPIATTHGCTCGMETPPITLKTRKPEFKERNRVPCFYYLCHSP
jgi:hypothetical protein